MTAGSGIITSTGSAALIRGGDGTAALLNENNECALCCDTAPELCPLNAYTLLTFTMPDRFQFHPFHTTWTILDEGHWAGPFTVQWAPQTECTDLGQRNFPNVQVFGGGSVFNARTFVRWNITYPDSFFFDLFVIAVHPGSGSGLTAHCQWFTDSSGFFVPSGELPRVFEDLPTAINPIPDDAPVLYEFHN